MVIPEEKSIARYCDSFFVQNEHLLTRSKNVVPDKRDFVVFFAFCWFRLLVFFFSVGVRTVAVNHRHSNDTAVHLDPFHDLLGISPHETYVSVHRHLSCVTF